MGPSAGDWRGYGNGTLLSPLYITQEDACTTGHILENGYLKLSPQTGETDTEMEIQTIGVKMPQTVYKGRMRIVSR